MSRNDLPTGTVTFLFTDVEGSTKLLHELGAEEYAEALAEHRRVLRDAFVRHGGVEVDTQGDAFFYAFPTGPAALEAAREGQGALLSGPIRVRMGLHTGRPHLTEEGYVGQDVHMGARIAAAGHGGQVLLSKETSELVHADVIDLGEHRLKDFEGPVWILQLGRERFPPLKTISNTNLPRPASSFVGREKEVEEVVSLLRDGARLLTLTGPGGSGKTRLSIEAAAELVPEFKAGVFWVGLAPLRDPALVVETIGQTLGAKDGVAFHIREREMLLVLDNLEQVVEAAPELSSLVEECPHLRVLVTSRELLRVRGEVEYPVPPLARPEAVELFCTRSRLKPDETIAELCGRLDNLPLAVELAAARASVLTPAQMVERLSQRLDLLRGGRDADARQQTLRATIEWSHDLLEPGERELFARLSVFRGGCTLGSAEDVAEADLDTLQALVDKSLLGHTEDRFWMLQTIREYARERLEDSGRAEELRRRHAEHFVALGEEAGPHMIGEGFRGGSEWLDRLERELDNLRAALDWLEASGENQLSLRLAAAVRHFWALKGHIVEGRRRLEKGLGADARPTAARAKALNAASDLATGGGDVATARIRAEPKRGSPCIARSGIRGAPPIPSGFSAMPSARRAIGQGRSSSSRRASGSSATSATRPTPGRRLAASRRRTGSSAISNAPGRCTRRTSSGRVRFATSTSRRCRWRSWRVSLSTRAGLRTPFRCWRRPTASTSASAISTGSRSASPASPASSCPWEGRGSPPGSSPVPRLCPRRSALALIGLRG